MSDPLSLVRGAGLALVLCAIAAAADLAAEPQTADAAAFPAEHAPAIEAAIRALTSPRFAEREEATARLIDAGPAAAAPLVGAIRSGEWEALARGLYVLREWSLSGNAQREAAAFDALTDLAASGSTAAARRARATLAQLDEIRQQRALDELQRLGAKVGLAHIQFGLQLVPDVFSVQIDGEFRGSAQDARHLRWLTGVQQVTLEGPQVTDEWLAHLAPLRSLSAVVVKRAKISDAGLAALRGKESLRQLHLWYVPLSDGAIEHLRTLPALADVRLFGAGITPQGAQTLAEALPGAKVDVRRGAFLGVGGSSAIEGCSVELIHPGSAAQRAGLQVGDVIVRYEDQPVPSFEALTERIGANAPGDRVRLTVVREGERLEKTIELGQWE